MMTCDEFVTFFLFSYLHLFVGTIIPNLMAYDVRYLSVLMLDTQSAMVLDITSWLSESCLFIFFLSFSFMVCTYFFANKKSE